MRRRSFVGIVIVSALVLTVLALWLRRPASSSAAPPPVPAGMAAPAANPPVPAKVEHPVEHFKVKVLATRKHDPKAYTQGLLWHDGRLLESTGMYGSSSLREVNPETGEVLRFAAVPERYFGEGLALVGDRLIQLTWREEVAFVYGLQGFEPRGQLSYTGEGWGLCSDGRRLLMSDGTDRITFRDPATFTPQGGVNVSLDGQPVLNVNELEWVDGALYANIWQTDRIVRIDPATGRVTAEIDASGLLTGAEAAAADVLNGIAWRPDTKTFYITGKNWPKLFEVVFVPASEGERKNP